MSSHHIRPSFKDTIKLGTNTMFVRPTRSKAIRIVKPPEEEEKKRAKDGTDRSSWTPLPPVHHVAIQQAVNAITSLTIGSRPNNTIQVSVSDPVPPVPGPVSVGGMNGNKHDNPMDVRVTANQRNKSSPTNDDDQEDCESAFNIYARPFIPEILTVINTLPGHQLLTSPKNTIDFDQYIYRSLGTATGFLPRPLPMRLPNTTSISREASSISPKHYEEFFQFHLHQEIQAQHVEHNTYSRKRHPKND